MAGTMAGKTIFISGASRGIGEAIALRCAQQGANIVIAAKTAEPHPKLPGTIYTVAKEIENVGGKALPCIVDIRSEEQVADAMNKAVDKFGGIDILVNNASAIHLTGTEATPMKKYDLMNSINTRGTFLCSKYAIPHLKKGKNAQILNISPPLNMKPRWFKDHVAYTMAKYGMSMCVLGMSEELKADGIAVNALWPRTAIWTAAMAMLGGGDAIKPQCRSVDIMADAAYYIFNRDSTKNTGNFYIDDEVLKEEGVTDIEKYTCVPGSKLLPDFFLDDFDTFESEGIGAKARFEGGKDKQSSGDSGDLSKLFTNINSVLNDKFVKDVGGIYFFDLKDDGEWYIDLKNGSGLAAQGSIASPDVTMTLSKDDFQKMFAGELDATAAFMGGKLKIKGNMALAMKLQKLMKQLPKASAGGGDGGSGVEETFNKIKPMLNETVVKDIGGVFTFELTDGDKWHLDLKNGAGAAGQGSPSGETDVTMTLSTEDFTQMFAGKLNATSAFMSGKLKIKGNLAIAMKLEKLMKQMQKSKL